MSAKKATVPTPTPKPKKKAAAVAVVPTPVAVTSIPVQAPAIIPASLPPLVSLRVGNFRALRQANVVFPDGLIGIVGRNGRGKSSFLKSITFALYAMGGVPSKWRKERLITRDAEVMKVELVFTVADHQYTVTRTLRRKGLTIEATLEREGLEPVTGNDTVTAEIVRLLGAADKLTISRFVSQKEVNALTVMDPAPRKRLILGLLGVEGVEGAIKSLRDQVTEFDKEIKHRKQLLPDVVTLVADREAVLLRQVELAARRRELEADVVAASVTLLEAEAEKVRRDQIEISVSASAETMKLKDDALADLATQERGIEARETEIAADALRLVEVDALLAAVEAHRGELDEATKAADLVRNAPFLREQQGKLDVQIAGDRRDLDVMEQTAAREKSLVAEERKLEGDISRLSDEFAAAEGVRGERRAELQRINNELELLRVQQAAIGVEPVGACPTCGQTIADETAFREHLAERERELETQKAATTKTGIAAKSSSDEAKTKQTAAETRLTAVRVELDAARKAASQLPLARGSLAAYEATRTNNAAELALLESLAYDEARHAVLIAENESVPDLTKEQGDLRASIAETTRLAADRDRIVVRRAGYQAQRDEAEAAAAAAGYDPEATAAARVAYKDARDATEAANVRITELAGQEDRAGDALAVADAAMADHGRLTADIDRVLADRSTVDITRQAMERFKIDLIGRIRPALSRKASELLREMTDGEYADLMLDEDYGISIGNGSLLWDPGEPSGGEDDLANLCLRLAISELIGESSALGPSFVVLDEVLGSQDDERRELVMAALPRLTGHFRQILMVAHVPGVQDRFQVVIPAEWDAVTRTSRFFYPPRDESLVATAD